MNGKIKGNKHIANVNKENSAINDNFKIRDEQQSQSFENYEKKNESQLHQHLVQQNKYSKKQLQAHKEKHDSKNTIDILQLNQRYGFQYQPNPLGGQQDSHNNTQTLHHQASLSQSFTLRDNNEGNFQNQQQTTPDKYKQFRSDILDSNGNVIRGRKLDSPQLVVVRELRDQEDLEEGGGIGGGTFIDQEILHGFHSGSNDDEMNTIWKTKDRTNSEHKRRGGTSHSRQAKSKSRSQENKKKSKSQQRYQRPAKEDRILSNTTDLQTINNKIKSKNLNFNNKGTKSSREIRSSMGFNELLNQLDKDVSLQQSHQHDFKNRTTHDLLKLELSGIRRQNSSGNNLQLQHNIFNKSSEKYKKPTKTNQHGLKLSKIQESKSKSQERKQAKSKSQSSNLPKSILKKNQEYVMKEQIFQYALNNADVTPDKNQHHQGINAASFLHSEHGRCTTSQGLHNNQNQSLYQQNGKPQQQQQQPSTSSTTNAINVLFSKIKLSKQNSKPQKDQSSPDRGGMGNVKEFKATGNIDKLVRENIRRMKSKEDEEKIQKLQNDDQQKRKKMLQDYKNSMVRKINKEKTYRKQVMGGSSNLQNFQQSQDLLQGSDGLQRVNKVQLDEKFMQINKNIISREKFMQKSSQSQKIDFEKIKESSKGKKLNIKNHRKSYGLEFIDIKKEIQEELRTIDLKFRNNFPDKILEESSHNVIELELTRPIRRLKIKSQKKIQPPLNKEDTMPLNQGADQFISERIQPIDKVIVVKKNKIRKFMKMKKKHLIIQKIKEQKEEIIKTMKMQENISKLNDFCKKKLEKQVLKKRNATIQANEEQLQHDKAEISKISGRKIVFDNTENKRTINNHIDDGYDFHSKDDSSRLSTEFYEEYFRLINSIKKEQQLQKNDNQSRMDISTQNITSKSYNNLLKSPGNNTSQSPMLQISNTQMTVSSPKPFHHHKEKSLNKKTKSKSNLKTHDNLKSQQKQSKQMIQSKSTLKSAEFPKNIRAESAPLLLNQHTSIKKKTQKQSSPSKEKKKTKRPKVKEDQAFNESQRIQFFLQQVVKIQSAYRLHLLRKGFYDQQLDTQQDMQQSVETAQHFISSDEFQTQVYDGNKLDSINNQLDPNNYQESHNNQHLEYGQEDDEDEYDEDDEDHENMIIINQQSMDDKKVVYMSNINSCSLPQTPKIEDQSINSKLQASNNMNNLRKVFEYKPGTILDQYQSISQKPSIESDLSDKIVDDKFRQTLKQLNQQSVNEHEEEEEEVKKVDYGMRLFTGSESLLREFKLNTPKQQPSQKKQEIPSNQTSVRNNITSSHQSMQSLSRRQQHQDSSSQNLEQNSHSSQSLFERNSFQQFTMQKLQQMMKNNEYMNLIEMREKALEYRQVKERKFIKKMLKNKQYSPRTYTSKKEQLEKWVQVEQEEIQKTKKQFQEEWQKTLQMIEETQKNVDKMREKMKIQIDNNQKGSNSHSHQYHSQSSRNSSSSFATISKQEQRKSILEQEEFQPISQRSLRFSIGSQQAQDQNKFIQLQKVRSSLKEEEKKEQQVAGAVQEEQNLIDYLEQSWVKNQQHQMTKQKEQRSSAISRQGIYIEDQNNKINSSQLSERTGADQIHDYVNESDELSQDKLIEQFNQQQLQQQLQAEETSKVNEERPLTRSRSEQDLSDLIKKSKINFNEFDLYQLEGQHHNELESYRIDNTQGGQGRDQNNEIKIQDNLFDDSSNRYSKGKNYYQDLNDLQSNDSLLNESELNNYFQDQKFSIEDFKSLDKRKILAQNLDDEDLLERNESQIFNEQNEESPNIESMNRPNLQDLRPKNDLIDSEPSFMEQRRNQENRLLTPDIQPTPFMQQNLIFQNAKPGENIKISDILKKTQSLQDPNSSSSFLYAQDTSQLLFQNTQINQSMVQPTLQPLLNDYEQLADQITEEIIASLLSHEVKVPHRLMESPLVLPQTQQQQQQQQQQVPDSLQAIPLQDPATADVFIIDAQMNEKEQRRELIEYRQRILIEQDLIRVENYINEVIQALQQAELNYLTQLATNPNFSLAEQQQNYHRQFLLILTTPIKRNELELLNQLQTSEIGSYEHFETAMDLSANPILPIDLYLDIERQREEQQLRMLGPNGGNLSSIELESSVIQESVHIHNKSVFDALNESLMKFRPYGIQGEPMPWSNKNRRLQTKVDTNSVDTERLFFMVKQDVLRWVQTFCGCQPSPLFVCRRDHQQQDSEQFDEELFQETRERRLAQMLATEVVENEHQWLNYEFEEAQVKIDLSDMILEHLVEEAAIFLNFKQELSLSINE